MAKERKKKEKTGKQTTQPAERKKVTRRTVVNAICIVILSLAVMGSTVAYALVQNILANTTITSELSALTSDSSTVIYDRDGEEIMTLSSGSGVRENVEYDDIPQVVIDAFIAVEDSRYFEHSGFDLPRFVASALNNVISGGIVQGGSTLTMQLVDVKLFDDEDDTTYSTETTVEKIEQKVVEIFKSMELETQLDKKEIITYYLNAINFGGSARGIEKGAQYYFGKSVSELTLSEAAFLAGVVNAPGAYNPYNVDSETGTTAAYVELATQRRNQVLDQMLSHGYITETEYALAYSAKLEFQLAGETTFDTDDYMSFIDAVIEEVIEETGYDPYTTTMYIYTTMDREAQELADSILDGDAVSYANDRLTTGFTAINNQTGEILAIGGGRGYGGDDRTNQGYSTAHQIGSTAKPLIEYTLAFEYLGYSTEHVIADTPVDNYTTDGGTLYNADTTFHGDVSLKDAIGYSYNIPAYKTFIALVEEIGSAAMIEIYNKMGIDITADEFDASISIGGGELALTTTQLAGAYATLANQGYYIEPYTVTKIVFEDEDIEDYEHETEEVQVFSEQAAYLMSYILRNNITQGYNTIKGLSGASYAIYAKSGTTDAPSGLAIPEGSSKDKWMVAYTDTYTVAVWLGYDNYDNPNNYFSDDILYYGTEGAIARLLLDELTDGEGDEIAKPSSGISTIKHIQGLYPYALTDIDGATIVTAYILSEYADDVADSVEADELEDLESFSFTLDDNTLSLTYSVYPDEDALDSSYDITVEAGGETFTYTPMFSKKMLFGVVKYYYEIYINDVLITTDSLSDETGTVEIDSTSGDTVTVCGFYAYENDSDTRSNQICQSATSKASSSTATTTYLVGSDFTALFESTSTYEEAVEAVTAWAGSTLSSVTIRFVESEDVEAGQLDTSNSTLYEGVTVTSGQTYIVAIGS